MYLSSLQHQPRPCADNWPVLAVVWDLGEVQPSKPITKYLTIVYDQVYSIRYVGSMYLCTIEPSEKMFEPHLLDKVDISEQTLS